MVTRYTDVGVAVFVLISNICICVYVYLYKRVTQQESVGLQLSRIPFVCVGLPFSHIRLFCVISMLQE